MRILMLPDWRRGNPYLDLLASSIRHVDPSAEIIHADYDTSHLGLFKSFIKAGTPDIVHLHWLNPLIQPIVWAASPLKRRLKIELLHLNVLLIRMHGAKVVWTIHNLISHESAAPDLERTLRRRLCKWVDRVIVHSISGRALLTREYDVDLTSRAIVIPHGNYDGCYPAVEANSLPTLELPKGDGAGVNILFFGAIRRYKGIERLLSALDNCPELQHRLVIAGRPGDPTVATAILHAASTDGRIWPILRFISEDEVPQLFGWADVVAVPFERTLTSGSVILALTMRRPVLTSETARVLDVIDDRNAIFHDDSSLENVLRGLNIERLRAMRLAARQSADMLNWDTIGRALMAAYE